MSTGKSTKRACHAVKKAGRLFISANKKGAFYQGPFFNRINLKCYFVGL
jgi:hypothetical protein